MARALVWFRLDLRLKDNPALFEAVAAGHDILPVFIWDITDDWDFGGASKWWLYHSLKALMEDIPLVLAKGDPLDIIPRLIADHGITAVYWNRNYEPHSIQRDTELKEMLKQQNVTVETYRGRLLHEPWEVKNLEEKPYKVFTPFWKKALTLDKPDAFPSPTDITWVPAEGDTLVSWNLLPTKPDWASGLVETWTPGEAGAWERLETFIETGLRFYDGGRDRPDQPENVSMLSPHLHWGEISPVQIWHFMQDKFPDGMPKYAQKFLSEIGWREFSFNILVLFPELPHKNWKPEFNEYPWAVNAAFLETWQQRKTGYPIVDAGMRQLYATGYMHNRVRMVVASFLIKHLQIHWKHGATWFWDTLVDADLASNSASWQWVAGSGADAAPYFRIFNPIGQGEKFDPEGDYVRQWVPEIAALPKEFIHKPWDAPVLVLRAADIVLGETYPKPIVDHKTAREAALSGYEDIKRAK